MNILLVCSGREARSANQYAILMNQAHGVTIRVCEDPVHSIATLLVIAKAKRCTAVVTTIFSLFSKLNPYIEGSYTDNQGTIILRDKFPVMLVHPIDHIHKVNHGAFLHRHYVAKLLNTDKSFLSKDKFGFEYITPANLSSVEKKLNYSKLVAVDIETSKPDPDTNAVRMTSVSYTYLTDKLQTGSCVIAHTPENYPFCMTATRILNRTRAPKVMQNGMYDSVYFVTYNAPLTNYIYDTHTLMHSMFPELPRDLAFMSGMFLTNFYFWKDESTRNIYEYNAKDTHNTLWLWLGMLSYIKARKLNYALKNFTITFPLHFPCLSCDLEGVLIDEEERLRLRAKEVLKKDAANKRLEVLLGQPLNSNSPKQVKAVLGLFDKTLEGTDEKTIALLAEKDPLVTPIVNAILDVRGCVKAIGTYFDMKIQHGRLFYHLAPAGTDTSRMASKASSYWCGTQIQNIPAYARSMVVFEDGWLAGAVDKSQSESYCTAYLANDAALKHTVTTSPDFHCQNASLFFGIPFLELYTHTPYIDTQGKLTHILRPDIRSVAKRINHGANYNMGARTLWINMGTKAVLEAKALLGLNPRLSILGVCTTLLGLFDKAYPVVRSEFYNEIKREVQTTGHLSTPTGWTRRTFLQPSTKGLDLNAAVASKPQGFSVQLVNKSFMRIWRELQLGKYAGKFRIKMQVHDEVVFIATPDVYEEALQDVHDYMIIPTMVRGDLMTIPSSKARGKNWAKLK
jgi:DNA polymerase I-like protein with 3'-5' exonuclease and polymerase domains